MDKDISPYQITSGVWMVPCSMDKSRKNYIPALRPLKNDNLLSQKDKRHTWSLEEDDNLREIVSQIGPKNWSAVAVQLNSIVHSGFPIRKGKQCRERWLGHLSPSIKKKSWNEQEDYLLNLQHNIHGNKWSIISKSLPGRTENQIKNRWRQIECFNKNLALKQQQILLRINNAIIENCFMQFSQGSFLDAAENLQK